MDTNESARGTTAEVPPEGECTHRAWQRVGRDRNPDEQAEFAGRRGSYRKPRDRDSAHPVAE